MIGSLLYWIYTGSVRMIVGLAVVGLAACAESPSFPMPSQTLPPVSSMGLQPPTPVAPEEGAVVRLVSARVTNSVRTGGGGAVRYEFEFATNPTFDPVYTVERVAEGVEETTVAVFLATGARFYWRARAVDDANGQMSGYSEARTFRTTPGCATFQPPIPIGPSGDIAIAGRPTLSAADGAYSGTAYTMGLFYQVSTDSSFRTILVTGRPHPMWRSTFTPDIDFNPGTRYFWRARAYDAKVCTSVGDFSSPQSFVSSGY